MFILINFNVIIFVCCFWIFLVWWNQRSFFLRKYHLNLSFRIIFWWYLSLHLLSRAHSLLISIHCSSAALSCLYLTLSRNLTHLSPHAHYPLTLTIALLSSITPMNKNHKSYNSFLFDSLLFTLLLDF